MNRLRNYISKKATTNGFQILIDEACEKIKQVESLHQEYMDITDEFFKYINEREKGILQELSDEDNTFFDEVKTRFEKFDNVFYSIIKEGGVQNVKEKLEKEILIPDYKISFASSKGFVHRYIEHDVIYTTSKYLKLDSFSANIYEVVLVELKNENDKPVKDDKEGYFELAFQLVIEDREKLEEFIPIFEEFMTEEDNFESLRDALINVEETIIYFKKAIHHFENRVTNLRLENSEEKDDFEMIDEKIEKYSKLKDLI